MSPLKLSMLLTSLLILVLSLPMLVNWIAQTLTLVQFP